MKEYEEVTAEIQKILILISYWGYEKSEELISIPFNGLLSNIGQRDGTIGLLAMKWYPLLLLVYSSGIAAVANRQYENLYSVLRLEGADYSGRSIFFVKQLFDQIENLQSDFKTIPGHERHYVPISEYLFKFFQPQFDDNFLWGKKYETFFDKFEVILALEHSNINQNENTGSWGPPGRFSWKNKRETGSNPLHELIAEGQKQKENWPLVKAGLFNGSFERFVEISSQYEKYISSFGWW